MLSAKGQYDKEVWEMKLWDGSLFLIIWAAALVATAVYVIYLWRYPHRRVKSKERTEEPLILIRNAVVRDKSVELMRTGTSKDPGHYLSHRVLFRFDDGTEEWLQVLLEHYEAISVGVRDKLVTQNGKFLDFGGRFGENIP